MTREEIHNAFDQVEEDISTIFRDQPERMAQLSGALATAHMAVDHLFDHRENVTMRGPGG